MDWIFMFIRQIALRMLLWEPFSGAFCNAGVIVKWTGMDNVGNVFLLYYILDHYEI